MRTRRRKATTAVPKPLAGVQRSAWALAAALATSVLAPHLAHATHAPSPLAPPLAPALAPPSVSTNDEAANDMAQRQRLRRLHFAFALTTWASLGATLTLDTFRYANTVGFGEPLCSPGHNAILGHSWGCGDGLRIQTLVSTSFTLGSYATTRTFAALMPDPYDAAGHDTPASRRLALHRALSWVHLAGMIALPILGVAASVTRDHGTRVALETTYLITGYTTFAAVTTAGAIMVF